VNGQLRIEEMYAFIVMDDDDTEGVLGFQAPGGFVPMVGADMEMVELLKPMAVKLSAEINKPVQLVKFSVREEVEVIGEDHQVRST
jgi:hypothetical protein